MSGHTEQVLSFLFAQWNKGIARARQAYDADPQSTHRQIARDERNGTNG